MARLSSWFLRSSATLLLLAVAGSAVAADAPISEKARQHFRAGVNFLRDPDGARYEEAYNEFKAAYADSPSWKILGNLGICAMKLERDGEAIDAFSTYLLEGGAEIDAGERAQFERDLATLKAGVVRLNITAEPPGVMLTDVRIAATGRITNAYGPVTGELGIGVRAGRHEITARLPGYKDAAWVFDAASGSTHAHAFKLEKEATAAPGPGPAPGPGASPGGGDRGVVMERPVPAAVWIGVAATGLFAVGAGVTGVMAMGKRSEFQDSNDGSDPTRAEELKSSGQTLNLVADILFGGAVVAGGVTAVLYFGRPEVPRAADAGLRFSPVVGRHGAGLGLSGQF